MKVLEDVVVVLKEIVFDIDIIDCEYFFDVCYFFSGMIVWMMNLNSYDVLVMFMFVFFCFCNLLRDIKIIFFYY